MRRSRALLSTSAVLGALLIAPSPPVVAQANGATGDCPAVLPVADVTPGMEGTGLTTSSGTTPDPFDVTVIDVLHDALAPGIPLIVVEVESPEIDRVGGIWAGMSGSPVYVDGQLLGAIAYGFSWAPSKLAGVTPAEAMLDVLNRPRLAPGPGEDVAEVEMSARVRRHASASEGVSAQQAGTMQQLRVPVRVSGPGGAKFDRFKQEFERTHPGTAVVRSGVGGGSTSTGGDIVAGGNLAVSLAYGDFNAVGVGTTTAVCEGTVLGFGHPMIYDGATQLGIHPASAVRVADDATLGPYKLANVGPIAGTIDHDRLAAVAGRLGALPATTGIRTTITNLDEDRTVAGRTDVVLPGFLLFSVVMHGWNNYDYLVFDDLFFSGSSDVSWTVSGVRRDGSPWEVTRSNRHADRDDLSTASLFEVALTAQLIHDNPFEPVRVTDIDYQAEAHGTYGSLQILSRQLAVSADGGPFVEAHQPIELLPGSTLRVRVPLRPYRSEETQEVELELEVPGDASGWGDLTVSGGGSGDDVWDCIWFPEECAGEDAASFADLLDSIAEQPRADDLVATLRLFPDGFEVPENPELGPLNGGPDEPIAPTTVSVSRRMEQVVSGRAEIPAFIQPDEEPQEPGEPEAPCAALDEDALTFWDVDPASTHARAIACAQQLGIARGTSTSPPLFSPDRPVRRDQAASFVARLLEHGPRQLPARAQVRFADLDGNVHREAIERLAAAGIVRGRTATAFVPGQHVTRAQIATMLVEAARWSLEVPLEAEGGPHFRDVGGVHAANVDLAFELGLVQGRGDGTFQPQRSTRRDQMASVLIRTLDLFHETRLPPE